MKYIGAENNNSYLLLGKKNVVIECVSKKNAKIQLENIKQETNTIDYIVLNHTSPECVGSLEMLLNEYPNAKVVSSSAGIKNISEILNKDIDYILAKDSLELEIDEEAVIKFFILPNLPWTDSMATYYPKEKVLFSGSIFDPKNKRIINNKFSNYAQNAVERLKKLDIKRIEAIAGNEITDIDMAFDELSVVDKTEDFIAVFYSSYYGYTEEMANVICDSFSNAKCYDVDNTDFRELVKAINKSKGFAVGTNTVNRKASSTILMLLTQIDLVNKKHTPCFVFGSYGWSGEGIYIVERFLKSITMNVFEKPFAVKFKMNDDDKINLTKYAEKFEKQMKGN